MMPVRDAEAIRILLIEDNPDHALLAKRSLEQNGRMRVFTAASASDGFRALRESLYDLVICDYRLPDTSGLELLRQIQHEHIHVPFIMLTGEGDERIAVSALQGGAYDYVIKDDIYLQILARTARDTMERYRGDEEKKRLEQEIRDKNRQLEKLNGELMRLDQMKNEFVASITHEFRTPLNSAMESILLLKERVIKLDENKADEIMTIAHKNIDRVSKMIDDLLDFSKLESGKMALDREVCSMPEMIQSAVQSVEYMARARGIQCVIRPSEVPDVYCDKGRIGQVLLNLLGNAIKFTPQGGSITIWAERVLQDRVKVSVQDTGIGIDPKMHLKIFERFEQVKRSNPGTELKGTGLGLSISRHIVAQHDGSIWVDSVPDKGSTFMFTIPVAKMKS